MRHSLESAYEASDLKQANSAAGARWVWSLCDSDPTPVTLLLNRKLNSLCVVKAAVVHRQLAPAMFRIDLGKTLTEANVTPAVVPLCLDGGRYDWVDSNH